MASTSHDLNTDHAEIVRTGFDPDTDEASAFLEGTGEENARRCCSIWWKTGFATRRSR